MNSKSKYTRLLTIFSVFLILPYDNSIKADTNLSESEQQAAYFIARTDTIWEWIQFKREADTLIKQTEKKIESLDKEEQNSDYIVCTLLTKKLEAIKQKLQIRNEEFIKETKTFNVSTVAKTYEFETEFTDEIQCLNSQLKKTARFYSGTFDSI